MRILLAEDNKTLADWLEKALRHAGFAVDCMHDGADADHVLLTQAYDLVILDLGLPSLDGLSVLEALSRQRPQVPVLVLSARSDPRTRLAAFTLGAYAYLEKPFAFDDLLDRVRLQGGRGAETAFETSAG